MFLKMCDFHKRIFCQYLNNCLFLQFTYATTKHFAKASDQSSGEHQCYFPNCGRSYNYRRNLLRHYRRSHGFKPYEEYQKKCQIAKCNKGFYDKRSLCDHYKTVHGIHKPSLLEYYLNGESQLPDGDNDAANKLEKGSAEKSFIQPKVLENFDQENGNCEANSADKFDDIQEQDYGYVANFELREKNIEEEFDRENGNFEANSTDKFDELPDYGYMENFELSEKNIEEESDVINESVMESDIQVFNLKEEVTDFKEIADSKEDDL